MSQRCDLTDLITEQCACRVHRGTGDPPPGEVTRVGVPFPARFPGRCQACDHGIREDDPIQRTDDGFYVHEGCPR